MKINKVLVSILILILIFFSFTKPVNAALFDKEESESDKIVDTIDDEDGGLFEKIIAKMIRRTSRYSI